MRTSIRGEQLRTYFQEQPGPYVGAEFEGLSAFQREDRFSVFDTAAERISLAVELVYRLVTENSTPRRLVVFMPDSRLRHDLVLKVGRLICDVTGDSHNCILEFNREDPEKFTFETPALVRNELLVVPSHVERLQTVDLSDFVVRVMGNADFDGAFEAMNLSRIVPPPTVIDLNFVLRDEPSSHQVDGVVAMEISD